MLIGKPSSLIGKPSSISGKMYPNSNYFEMYNIDASLPDVLFWDYGYAYIILKVCQDGGFWSEGCIKSIASCCDAFIMGMPAHLKESEEILVSNGNGIDTYSNELTCHHVNCAQVTSEIYGVHGRVLLFYDAWNHLRLCDELSSHIVALESELAALKRYPKSKLSRYSPYFSITKHQNDNGFDYIIDVVKAEKLRKRKGFYLFILNRHGIRPF